MIAWSKYRLGNPSHAMYYGIMWPMGISTVFQRALTVPFHSPNSRHMPAVRAVQGDCERVYGDQEKCRLHQAFPMSPATAMELIEASTNSWPNTICTNVLAPYNIHKLFCFALFCCDYIISFECICVTYWSLFLLTQHCETYMRQ